MTGNPPQPGETPHDQGNPWAPPEPETAWWRDTAGAPTPPTGLPVVAARSAGARDLTAHLAEQDTERLATAGELMIIEPAARPVGSPPPAEVRAAPEVEARLENSPFWMSEEERAAADEQAGPAPVPRRRPPADNPLRALLCLIVLSLVAAFFGWVSAEPFWLAVGHGDRGYAVTAQCRGTGLAQRCVGQFAAEDFSVAPVTLLGVAGDRRHPGAVSPARMVGPGSDQAYASSTGPLVHLRWGLGFLFVLICGYGIAETTGARRLPSRPARRGATIASFLGPLAMLGGFLIAAY
ncbi:hypothetical protein [Actinoplanes subglobosus]|uniref:Uncharacterized protein n=1 Tax=Actinoplanes subglobosus TaxID=1547892 RepID=A0ABV8IT19_9ACTN